MSLASNFTPGVGFSPTLDYDAPLMPVKLPTPGAKVDRSLVTSAASQQAAAANAGRTRLIIKNADPTNSFFVNLGAPATAGMGSIEVGPKGFLELVGTTQAVFVIAGAGTPTATIWEF